MNTEKLQSFLNNGRKKKIIHDPELNSHLEKIFNDRFQTHSIEMDIVAVNCEGIMGENTILEIITSSDYQKKILFDSCYTSFGCVWYEDNSLLFGLLPKVITDDASMYINCYRHLYGISTLVKYSKEVDSSCDETSLDLDTSHIHDLLLFSKRSVFFDVLDPEYTSYAYSYAKKQENQFKHCLKLYRKKRVTFKQSGKSIRHIKNSLCEKLVTKINGIREQQGLPHLTRDSSLEEDLKVIVYNLKNGNVIDFKIHDYLMIPITDGEDQLVIDNLEKYEYAMRLITLKKPTKCGIIFELDFAMILLSPGSKNPVELAINSIRMRSLTSAILHSRELGFKCAAQDPADVSTVVVHSNTKDPSCLLKKFFVDRLESHFCDERNKFFGYLCSEANLKFDHTIYLSDQKMDSENIIIQDNETLIFNLIHQRFPQSRLERDFSHYEDLQKFDFYNASWNTILDKMDCCVIFKPGSDTGMTPFKTFPVNAYAMKMLKDSSFQKACIVEKKRCILIGLYPKSYRYINHEMALNAERCILRPDVILAYDESLNGKCMEFKEEEYGANYLFINAKGMDLLDELPYYERLAIDGHFSDVNITRYGYAVKRGNDKRYCHVLHFAGNDESIKKTIKNNDDIRNQAITEIVIQHSGGRLKMNRSLDSPLKTMFSQMTKKSPFVADFCDFYYNLVLTNDVKKLGKALLKEPFFMQLLSNMTYISVWTVGIESQHLIAFYPKSRDYFTDISCVLNAARRLNYCKPVLCHPILCREAAAVVGNSSDTWIVNSLESYPSSAFDKINSQNIQFVSNKNAKAFGFHVEQTVEDFFSFKFIQNETTSFTHKEPISILLTEINEDVRRKNKLNDLVYGCSSENGQSVNQEDLEDILGNLMSIDSYSVNFCLFKDAYSLKNTSLPLNKDFQKMIHDPYYTHVMWTELNQICLFVFSPPSPKYDHAQSKINAHRQMNSLAPVVHDPDLDIYGRLLIESYLSGNELPPGLEIWENEWKTEQETQTIKRKKKMRSAISRNLTINSIVMRPDLFGIQFDSFGVGDNELMEDTACVKYRNLFLTNRTVDKLSTEDILRYLNWLRKKGSPLVRKLSLDQEAEEIGYQYKKKKISGVQKVLTVVMESSKDNPMWKALLSNENLKTLISNKQYDHVGISIVEKYLVICLDCNEKDVLDEKHLHALIKDRINTYRSIEEMPNLSSCPLLNLDCKNKAKDTFPVDAATKLETIDVMYRLYKAEFKNYDIKSFGYHLNQKPDMTYTGVFALSKIGVQDMVLTEILNNYRKSRNVYDIFPSHVLNKWCELYARKEKKRYDRRLSYHSPGNMNMYEAVVQFIKEYPAEADTTILSQLFSHYGYGWKRLENGRTKWFFMMTKTLPKDL